MRVTITSTVLGTSRIGRRLATICSHLREVKGTVKTARKFGDIDVESELFIQEVEDLVVGIISHEVETRTNVLLLALSDEFQSKSGTGGGDTVCACVVSTIERTVLGTSCAVRTNRSIPFVTSVAVGEVVDAVSPTPVSVEGDFAVHVLATTAGAPLPSERWVVFGHVGTDLLAQGNSSEGEGEENGSREHVEFWREDVPGQADVDSGAS